METALRQNFLSNWARLGHVNRRAAGSFLRLRTELLDFDVKRV